MGNLADYFEDPVHVKIIDCLLDATTDLSKKQIAKNCGISKATLFNHWANLEKLGLVKVSRKFGKTKLYKIDRENPIVNKLLELRAVLPEVKVQIPQKEEKIVEAPQVTAPVISPPAPPAKTAEVPKTEISPQLKTTEVSQTIPPTTSPRSKPSFLARFKQFKLPPIKKAKKPKKAK